MGWADIVGDVGNNQYGKRIDKLKGIGIDTTAIEQTVAQTITNLAEGEGRSFVIFGEPQSGKTEMMIALCGKLLDEGASVIVNLLTDSVDLLGQSLDRFRLSGLSPSPKPFSELPPTANEMRGKKWVIFSKKNARDLEKLIDLLRHQPRVIVIDDEADYASPNAKVNSKDEKHNKTKINKLIWELLGDDGQYIGVTATPARLNLNNTFDNASELWVDFQPHPSYVGQDYFFPKGGMVPYRLHTFDVEEGDEKAELENAILHFLCGVAQLHLKGVDQNFTMLVHTSGKKDDHETDVDVIRKTIDSLSSGGTSRFNQLLKRLLAIAAEYDENGGNSIVDFVVRNILKHTIIEINSKKTSGKVADIAKPTSLFSFGAGGNIISRGVTFDNLLSMYFARAVKGKFSQDTYIQRARMFGSRNSYKDDFQLWIPAELMANWSKCFEFHKLAIEAMRSSTGAPVWLSDHKTTPTSAASIDRSSVDFEGGEMSFGLFDFDEDFHSNLFKFTGRSDAEILADFEAAFTETEFPSYVQRYLAEDLTNHGSAISVHKPSPFGMKSKTYSESDRKNIRRDKSVFATTEYQRSSKPGAKHHLKIFYNGFGKARLFYKINGKTIRFMQNRK